MLSTFRKHSGSWLIKVILGLIVLVFVFWGVGSFRDEQSTAIAHIDGEPIAYDDYLRTYNNMLERFSQQFGDNLSPETLKMLGLKDQAVNQLINQRLLSAEADRLGLRVSPDELVQMIQQVPAFQSNGVFDSTRYQQVLGNLRMTPEIFEDQQREALRIEKLQAFVGSGATVSDIEAREWYQWQNNQVKIDYFMVAPSKDDSIALSDEEIAGYFKENADNYKTKPQAKARFIRFAATDFNEKVELTDNDIAAYYAANKATFGTPKTVEARHILIRVDENADDETVEDGRKRLLPVLELARAGEDFGELAKIYSEGPTAEKGGALGAFQKEAMVAPFAEKAFSMGVDEISDPIRTRFGWHLIKVEKINEATTKALEEVKETISETLKKEETKELASDAAEAFYENVFPGDDLEKIGTEQKITVTTTDFFDATGPKSITVGRGKFAQDALVLNPGDISELLNLGDDYYLLQTIEKKEAQIPELEAVKDEVLTDLLKQKQDEKAAADAEAILAGIGGAVLFETAVKDQGLEVKTTEFFNRNDAIPDIGQLPELTEVAFALTSEKSVAEKPIKGPGGYYGIQLNDIQPADEAGFSSARKAIEDQLVQQKRGQLISALVEKLKGKSEIEINQKLLE